MKASESGLWSNARQLVAELRSYRWNSGAYVSTEAPILLGGCGRSGTTLLRVILDSHSQVCCGPESELFAATTRLNPGSAGAQRLSRKFDIPEERLDALIRESSSRAELIDRFFGVYRAQSGKQIWADKTPRNIQVLPFILEHFPRARIVHVIRDGRDVACSLRTHPRHRVVDGKLVKLDTWNPIEDCIARWVNDVQDGLRLRGDPRYHELRYEDVILATEPTLRKLLTFLELPWEPAVMSFHEVQSASRDPLKFAQNPEATKPLQSSSIGHWQRNLSSDDLEIVMRAAGPLLRELGYPDDRQDAAGADQQPMA